MNLFTFDKIRCGSTQISASFLGKLIKEQSKVYQLAFFRLLIAFLLFCEILGYFFITYGLIQQAPLAFFIIGMILKIGGGLANSVLQNKAGVLWTIELYSYLKIIKTYSQEISAKLTSNGCSESEIQALSSLPSGGLSK